MQGWAAQGHGALAKIVDQKDFFGGLPHLRPTRRPLTPTLALALTLTLALALALTLTLIYPVHEAQRRSLLRQARGQVPEASGEQQAPPVRSLCESGPPAF